MTVVSGTLVVERIKETDRIGPSAAHREFSGKSVESIATANEQSMGGYMDEGECDAG